MGDLLKQLRQELGMSQTDFAKATLAVQPTVSAWENGSRVPTKAQFKAILRLANGAPLLVSELTTTWLAQ